MKFTDMYVFEAGRFSIGIEEQTRKYYLSIPVANRLVDYEEYYEISKAKLEEYMANPSAAAGFVRECHRREHDACLIVKPGRDRGAAV